MLAVMMLSGCQVTGWRAKLDRDLPAMGHRNWIVIADAAYPRQSAPGIETVVTGAGQLEVLETVLQAVEEAPHVQAIVWVDAELESVAEEDAPGVAEYRAKLKHLLQGANVQSMPHEQIIHKLDADSKTFNVLLLKTDMVLPYTSVFLQLDCGYWDGPREERLRQRLRSGH